MPAERYFVNHPIQKGDQISLETQEFHHLVHVMRTKEGEEVEIINGAGLLAHAIVEKIKRNEAILTVTNVQTQPPSQSKFTLIQAIPRLNRLEIIIEKCTELGVDEICLWTSSLSERKEFSPNQKDRLHNIAIAAIKQCGRLYLPSFCWISDTKNIPLTDSGFFGDVAPSAPHFKDVWKPKHKATFVIGPESGLTQKETELLVEKGYIGVKLHPNILRTDTAAIVALALMS